jgi:hypothetical protein
MNSKVPFMIISLIKKGLSFKIKDKPGIFGAMRKTRSADVQHTCKAVSDKLLDACTQTARQKRNAAAAAA